MAEQLVDSDVVSQFTGGAGTMTASDVKHNVVRPLFEADFGGLSGRFLVVAGASLLFLALTRIFIFVAKLLAGLLTWIFSSLHVEVKE